MFGKLAQKIRNSRNLTHKQMAAKLSKKFITYYMFERQGEKVTAADLIAMYKISGLSAANFMAEVRQIALNGKHGNLKP